MADILVRRPVDEAIELGGGIDRLHFPLEFISRGFAPIEVINLFSQAFGRPPKMGFQDLAHIHSGWNTEWVEDDIHRGSVDEVRHIFFRKDA